MKENNKKQEITEMAARCARSHSLRIFGPLRVCVANSGYRIVNNAVRPTEVGMAHYLLRGIMT